MTTPQPQLDHRANDPEAGYMLLAVVVMVVLVLLALSVAAPVIARDLRRDKEVESMHRALEYERAIQLYTKRGKGPYPGSMDALEKGVNIRFLRQKYTDPLTGKADWRLIHQPQTKTRFPFGEELTGLTPGGGGLGSAAGLASGGTTQVGATNSLAAGFGGATVATPNAPGATGASGATGSTGSTGSTGGIFGDGSGGVIYGVATARTGDSILNPNQQTTYETWEFWYDPQMDALRAKANVMGGGGLGSTSASNFGQDATTGLSGASGSTGASGITATPGIGSPTQGFGTQGSGR